MQKREKPVVITYVYVAIDSTHLCAAHVAAIMLSMPGLGRTAESSLDNLDLADLFAQLKIADQCFQQALAAWGKSRCTCNTGFDIQEFFNFGVFSSTHTAPR